MCRKMLVLGIWFMDRGAGAKRKIDTSSCLVRDVALTVIEYKIGTIVECKSQACEDCTRTMGRGTGMSKCCIV